MAVQTEVIGYGSKVYVGTAGSDPTVLVAAEITDIKPPQLKVKNVASSHMASPGQVEQSIPGWISYGEGEYTAHYTAAEYATIKAFKGIVKAWAFKLSDNSGQYFDGYIVDMTTPVKLEGLVEVTVKIQPAGDVTFNSTLS